MAPAALRSGRRLSRGAWGRTPGGGREAGGGSRQGEGEPLLYPPCENASVPPPALSEAAYREVGERARRPRSPAGPQRGTVSPLPWAGAQRAPAATRPRWPPPPQGGAWARTIERRGRKEGREGGKLTIENTCPCGERERERHLLARGGARRGPCHSLRCGRDGW